ncbi:MAG: NUDIX domain-containing protein [Prolixibacteraceae bacterium]|nr:NUDIX domain-containing protein [Prolixibacteraceae bacterium]
MYEVFYNDSKLIFTDASANKSGNKSEYTVYVDSANKLDDVATSFLRGNIKSVNISGDVNKLWPTFTQMFQLLPAAGGLAENGGRYLFIFRRGKWDLPKGKIDPGETPKQAALREVGEETGLQKLTICRTLPSTWHIYESPQKKSDNGMILKQTHWFLMQSEDNQKLIPQAEEDIEIVRWIKPEDLAHILENAWPSVANLIEKVVRRQV